LQPTGLPRVYPVWRVEGAWPRDGEAEIALGADLARQRGIAGGEIVQLQAAGRGVRARVTGVFRSGGEEDARAVVPLALAQRLAARPGKAREAVVSAVTTPESRTLEQAAADPKRMSPADYDQWYCTN
jgi:putative ABC transport system permease protein